MTYATASYWSAPRPEDVEEFESYYTESRVPAPPRTPGATCGERLRYSSRREDERRSAAAERRLIHVRGVSG
ncbi:hypothetical protein [Aeromicrobium sp.]|uniref:hypothetical protein n=1 Tax=Aeromicrobium sp. TaxID=1871063 RepID=UPI00198D644A|nr:hypothetical protein [Aeromicrobium sp.]MBC7633363.1 hypothetical protein [Aeromicrobium sp.]